MSTKFIIATFLALVAVSMGCDQWPNGTDTQLHWYNCPDDGNIVFHTLQAVDASGKTEYPVKLKKPLYINANIDNNAGKISEIRLDVSFI